QDVALPEIKGSVTKTMSIEEIAKAYSIDIKELIDSLRINVSPKTRIEGLRLYGITNSMAKEQIKTLFIGSNKKIYDDSVIINPGHSHDN
ncbi:MAG: hypothetical protein RBS85_07475, partial [Methanofastidiosum sp.]|nr:hypothetical protein [Methanofastidiosum sp.]